MRQSPTLRQAECAPVRQRRSDASKGSPVVPSLLVTNDFPPKIGGIQSYLYELWRRLPPQETSVLTTRYEGAPTWDASQAFHIERVRQRVLLPMPVLARRVDAMASARGVDTIFLDPLLPLGLIGSRLAAAPYVVLTHGAEVTVPGRLPVSSQLSARVLGRAAGIVAAGDYPARVAQRIVGRALPTLVIPPGVDVDRFKPVDDATRSMTRLRFGLPPVDGAHRLVLGLSRLVPRKGFDVLIDAVARMGSEVVLAIAGSGRDRRRLEARAASRGIADRVRFLGRVEDSDLPALYASADVFAMLCRDRWKGLEAEGFGIVFLEAAACGVPAIAGRSGGSHDAVADGETGLIVDPHSSSEIFSALTRLLGDDELRLRFGAAARARAVLEFSYDILAERLLGLTRGDFTCLVAGER